MYVLLLCKPFEMILIKFMPIERVILKAPAQKCLLCATIFLCVFKCMLETNESKLKYFYIAPFTNFNFYSN